MRLPPTYRRLFLTTTIVLSLILCLCLSSFLLSPTPSPPPQPYTNFVRGLSSFPPDTLTKHLIIPHLLNETSLLTSWTSQLPPSLNLSLHSYSVSPSHLHPLLPKNKGHESLPFLTHLIAHYDSLPDVLVFVHAHAAAWHNNDLQFSTTALMLRELNYRRVAKRGYVSLRCHWRPGCPDWIRPGNEFAPKWKKEELSMAAAFSELFLGEPVPEVLAAGCCAQFAVSRAAVRRRSRTEYEHYRDWVLRTDLPDQVSGRVMEYLWHYIFTGRTVICPEEEKCYCDQYGICFEGGRDEYENHMRRRAEVSQWDGSLRAAKGMGAREGGDLGVRSAEIKQLEQKVWEARQEVEMEVQKARKAGRKAEVRRKLVGDAEWTDVGTV